MTRIYNTCITSDLGEAMYLVRWRNRAPKLTDVDIVPDEGTANRLLMTFEGSDVFMDHYDYMEGKCGQLDPDPTSLSRLFKEILALVRAKKKARITATASVHTSTKLSTGASTLRQAQDISTGGGSI
jgi:hypothetical protein